MKKIFGLLLLLLFSLGCTNINAINLPVTVTYFGHSSVMIEKNNQTVYIDPFVLPNETNKADFILVSHNHFDHCDIDNIKSLERTFDPKDLKYNDTRVIGTIECVKNLTGRTNSIHAGEYYDFQTHDFKVEAVEAYNINNSYHKKEEGVGFIISINSTRIYFAGDTDLIPEINNITNIDIAFLPIGGTYTMNVKDASEAARIIKPKYVIPIHYNSDKYGITGINADPQQLIDLLKGTGINVIVMNPII